MDIATVVRTNEEAGQCQTQKKYSQSMARIMQAWVASVSFIQGSLEVKLPTICRHGKAEVGRVREEKSRSEKSREEKEWEARRCRCAKR